MVTVRCARSKNDHAYSIGFVKLRMAVTRVGYFQSADRGKNDCAYRRFPNLHTAVTTDDNISSYLTEAEMTVHVCTQHVH